MTTEKRLIDVNARIEEIRKAHCTNCDNYDGVRCRSCWVDDGIGFLEDAPTVDAVEVPDKKLLRAIKLLIKQYEHSKNSDYVHSPVAHALFHTWKQVDERRIDNA